MVKDIIFTIASFFGMFTLTVNAFYGLAGILFIIISIKLVVDIAIAVHKCMGEHKYASHSKRRNHS